MTAFQRIKGTLNESQKKSNKKAEHFTLNYTYIHTKRKFIKSTSKNLTTHTKILNNF